MVELFASSSAVSDLGLQCLPITLFGFSRLQWVKSQFRTIFLAYTQRQSTHQCCQCFDFLSYRHVSIWVNTVKKEVKIMEFLVSFQNRMESSSDRHGVQLLPETILSAVIEAEETAWGQGGITDESTENPHTDEGDLGNLIFQ